ncbi:acetyl esterase [Jatrophihabitans endophyticus]|uniref:Acetyl esterase n=1 Tax=Jatrophihabitans endophyticus TaxID=1206085 RepID=A0A1M5CWB4_9ACTN|nr:alpha/beta hydrolase [Jatrophihabitans endophyticus]SHF59018.1 acetyl esterase [Jatrophihabitans endophyticus]
MAIPLKTAAFWAVYRVVGGSVMQQPADSVRKASDLRNRSLRLPGAKLIIGRADPSVSISQATYRTADGTEQGLRVYRPAGIAAGTVPPVVVNFHGGGWVSGSPEQSEWWCAGIAARTGAVVASVTYRLAPEHPFPTPVEDCYAATAWVAEHGAELGVDTSRLAVMGDSAGGNMAAVVSVMARDRGGPAIALQVLLYPSVDFVTEYPSKTENANAPVLSARDMDNVPRLYLQDADPKVPYASPLFADHHGLPPALIQTAEFDPLRDQGPAYAAALREAGVPVRLTNYVDAVHGYISLPNVVYAARQAQGEAAAALRDAFTR